MGDPNKSWGTGGGGGGGVWVIKNERGGEALIKDPRVDKECE